MKLKDKWPSLSAEGKIPNEKKARDHLAKQGYMQEMPYKRVKGEIAVVPITVRLKLQATGATEAP